MRPTDARLRHQLVTARRPLGLVVLASTMTSLLVIGQAFALTGLLVAAVNGHDLLRPALMVGVVFAAKALTGVLTDLAAARAAVRVSASLRRDLADAVLTGRTESLTEGELAALATRGVSAAEPYVTRYLPAFLLAGVLPVLTVVAIATQDLLSAGIVLATLPLVPVFGALVGLATRDRAAAQWRAMASLSGHFVDVMRGLPTLVAFRRADAQVRTIRMVAERYRASTMKTLRIAFASAAVLELVATLSVALVAVVVGVRLAAGHLDLHTALVVLLLAPEAYWPLRRVGAEFHAAAEGVATFERMSGLVTSSPSSSAYGPGPDGLLVASGVAYTYPGRSSSALVDVDATFAPRSVTAIVGPSGCGKSTLLALLAGLAEPTTGSITVGGVPAAGAAWQAQVAWVPQRPGFLDGSVAANLRLAGPGTSDADLWTALEQVALAERVRVAGGLEAEIGEDGATFSAGERARLALARAVVSRRPWVLLDEPTAHLDPLTRQVMLDAIVELSRTAGVVVVAHEPAVVEIADRVLDLPPARVVAPEPTAPVVEPVPAAEVVVPDADPIDGIPRFGLSTVLGVLSAASGVALTATAGWLIVQASTQPPVLTLLVAIVGVRTFGLGRPVLRYAERLRSHDAVLRLLTDRRVAIYRALVPLTPGRLGKRRGDLLASVVDDVDAVVDRELRIKLPLRTYLAVLVLASVVAAWLLPAAGLALLATSAAGTVAAYLITRVTGAGAEQDTVAARAALSARFLDAAQLAPELRMWQARDAVLTPIATIGQRLAAATRRVAAATTCARATVQLSAAAGVVVVGVISSDALRAGHLSAPSLALLLLLPVALADVAAGVVEAGGLVGRVRSAEARLDSLVAVPPAVADPVAPEPTPGSFELSARDLSVGWGARTVLSGLDLETRTGQHVAIVGPSGSGKSTLAAALIRFIDPLAGRLCLGSVPLSCLALDTVRRDVGYVDDDPHVFATSVLENVRLARPEATDDEVAAALERAQLGGWVAALPQGMRTMVGEGHGRVSGGERARLGLARSLLLDQPVLVLDEPVAHLDRTTAALVSRDLLDSATGRTVVWITHSDLALDRMDQIVDLGALDVTGWRHG